MIFSEHQAVKLREIKGVAAFEILSVQPQHRQLNQLRAVLVEMIGEIPEEEHSESMTALTAADAQINAIRTRSNELEALAEASQTEEELAAIEITF